MPHRLANRTLSRIAPFGGHHQFASGKKFFAHIDRLFEQAAWVPPEIQNQRLHSLPAQLLQRCLEVFVSLLSKLHQSNIADLIFPQRKLLFSMDIFDHVNVDDRARQLIVSQLIG